jgi:uncharacterized SAM-binding protein YcdF (DUF218 family)
MQNESDEWRDPMTEFPMDPKEKLLKWLGSFWLLPVGGLMAAGALLYRPYGRDMQFLMDFLPVLGGILLLLGLAQWRLKRKHRRGGLMWTAYYTSVVLLILWASTVAMVTGTLLAESKNNPTVVGADVVLLGAELSAEHDTAILDSRVKPTAEYLKQNPETRAILCGGAAAGESLTTAQYMKEALVAQGVGADRLILEETSQTAREAVQNAKPLVEGLQGGSQQYPVGLISNEFQLYRARKYAEQEGLEVAKMCIKTPLVRLLTFNFFLREYFKVIPFWLGF